MYKIKVCPFCGGEPYLETCHRAFINGESTRVAYVRCSVCYARAARYRLADYGRSNSSTEANKRAIEAWNRRCYSDEICEIKSKDEKRRDKISRGNPVDDIKNLLKAGDYDGDEQFQSNSLSQEQDQH